MLLTFFWSIRIAGRSTLDARVRYRPEITSPFDSAIRILHGRTVDIFVYLLSFKVIRHFKFDLKFPFEGQILSFLGGFRPLNVFRYEWNLKRHVLRWIRIVWAIIRLSRTSRSGSACVWETRKNKEGMWTCICWGTTVQPIITKIGTFRNLGELFNLTKFCVDWFNCFWSARSPISESPAETVNGRYHVGMRYSAAMW
jgi:hypothetical protein